jgi:hypothetical protein
MKLVRIVAITAAVLSGCVAASAQQAAPAKAKPAAAKAVAGDVLVDNRREATLLELSLKAKGADEVVVAKDLGPGAKLTAKLPAKAGCVFDVSGFFDDESVLEVAGVNLCKDKRLTLVE